MQRIIEQLRDIWGRLSGTQRAVVAGVTGLSITALILIAVWANAPDFTVLYANLDPESAGRIVNKLKDQKIPYRLEQNGAAILIPSEKVYEMRLQLAGQGLPAKEGVGYEIFDNPNLGMTDFVQRLNYRRALEGEISRTIESLDEVRQARVHLVIPEHRLFTEDQQKTTASVFVKLSPARRLSRDQIQGITYLVASSVEGMHPADISIIDANGRLLSDNNRSNTALGLSVNQLEMQENVEAYLARKAQAMLDGVLGANNAIVRVHAELNFEKMERSIEAYDPDTAAIRSEEKNEAPAPGNAAAGGQAAGNSSITNYELNKRVEHVVGAVGNITRLSVAVIVNETRDRQDGTTGGTPIDPDALKKLVQNAVGFNIARQDQIEVSMLPFDTSQADRERMEFKDAERQAFIMSLVQKALMGALIVGMLLFARSLMKRARPIFTPAPLEPETVAFTEIEEKEGDGSGPPRLDSAETGVMLPKEVNEQEALKDRILVYISKEPERAAGLVRAWLLEQ